MKQDASIWWTTSTFCVPSPTAASAAASAKVEGEQRQQQQHTIEKETQILFLISELMVF